MQVIWEGSADDCEMVLDVRDGRDDIIKTRASRAALQFYCAEARRPSAVAPVVELHIAQLTCHALSL